MPPIIAKLANAFASGSLNEAEFVDLPFMKEEHVKALQKFISRLANGEGLEGKNKPSWLNDNLDEIKNTQSYKDNNYWHYHCGPGYSNSSLKSITYNLNMNLDGMTSPEVIHYQKESDGTILIVGFSPEHIPFPTSDDPNYDNPLFSD